jgi:N-acetyltransferase 10
MRVLLCAAIDTILTCLQLGRYAIDDTSADWSVAEAQVTSLASDGAGKSTVVSVKSVVHAEPAKKRKSREDDAPPKKGEKKLGVRRSMKKARHA